MIYKVGRVKMGFIFPNMYVKNFSDYSTTREGFEAAKKFQHRLKWAAIGMMGFQATFNIVTSITSAAYLDKNDDSNYDSEEVANRVK